MTNLQKVGDEFYLSCLTCFVASRSLRPTGSQSHFKNRRPTKVPGGNVVVPLPIKAKPVLAESEIESSGIKGTQPGSLSKEPKKISDTNAKKTPPSTVWGEGTRSFLIS